VGVGVKKIIFLFFAMSILSCILLLSGCEKDRKAEKEVQEFLQRAEKIAQIKREAEQKKENPIVSYVYEGDNLRDPFDRSENVVVAKRHEDSILSDMSLDDLKLMGTVLRKENSWAIVRGSDGKLYRLTKGVHVGVQQAMLIEIKQGEIILKTEPEIGAKEKSSDIVMKVQE